MKPFELARLSDDQLAALADDALARLTPRARAHALAVASGKTAAAAAREAGTSTNGRVLARMKSRTAPALALLREQQRRKSLVTAEETARWFEALADDAWTAKDYGAARAARREAALIRGAYPADARHVIAAPVQIVVHTGLPERAAIRAVLPERSCLAAHGQSSDLVVAQALRDGGDGRTVGVAVPVAVKPGEEREP